MLVLLFYAGREKPGEFCIWKWTMYKNLCFDHSVWSLSPEKKILNQIPYIQKRKRKIHFINLQENFNDSQKSMNMNILKML